MTNEIILNPPEPIEDIPVETGSDQKHNKKDKKSKGRKKRPLQTILNLLILTLIGVSATEVYFRMDGKFKDHQKHLNNDFSESVTLMVTEYEKDRPVRGLHDIKDPFEGWEKYHYHSLSFRYPPEISPEHTILQNEGCAHSSGHFDFTSSQFRQLHSGIVPEGTEEQLEDFYKNAFGMTICHFPNTDDLALVNFVLAPNTWLPNTTKYNGDSDRSRITRNWINANVDRTLEGYIFEGNITTAKTTTILFLKERDIQTIYIFELDQNHITTDDDITEELRNVFNRILTSINWRVR